MLNTYHYMAWQYIYLCRKLIATLNKGYTTHTC